MWGAICTTISKAVGDIAQSVFNFLSAKEQKKECSDIIKDKHRLKKATDIAEEMWGIAFKNIDRFEEKDRKKFLRLHDDFLDFN